MLDIELCSLAEPSPPLMVKATKAGFKWL